MSDLYLHIEINVCWYVQWICCEEMWNVDIHVSQWVVQFSLTHPFLLR